MTSAVEIPPGGFPKAIHGYNVGAVDDYFRKMNSRLESLDSQVQSESSRADQGKRLLEQMTSELETMRRRASDAEKREVAALEGQKQAQQELAKLSQELKESNDKARIELENALADLRQERDILLAEERQDAEAVIAEARKSAAAEVEEAQRELDALKAEIARLKSELEAAGNSSPAGSHAEGGSGHQLDSSDARARIDAELAAQRQYARSQIEIIVNEARSEAQRASEQALAALQEQEKRVRALGDDCEAIIAKLKETIESLTTQPPAASNRRKVTPVAAPARNEEPEENRLRDKHDWRRGDWRNAS